MGIKTYRFDIAEHLEDEEDIKIFLEEASKECTSSEFIHALHTAARAHGMTLLAKQIGVSRTSLYKSLAEDGNPEYQTITKIIQALGCKFLVAANPPVLKDLKLSEKEVINK